MRSTFQSLLHRAGIYRPVRTLYQAVFGGEGRKRRDRLTRFYSQFVSPNDLVFDIGANTGVYTEVFASLGVRVVAVEPNPKCVRIIRLNCPVSNVSIVEAAVGSTYGSGRLRMPSSASPLASMSTQWIAIAAKSKRFQDVSWDEELTVPIVTIDMLIQKYGTPKFIKIDIEGYEENALRGLSIQPELLSFEFNTEDIDTAVRCVNTPPVSSDSRFNYVIEEPSELKLQPWVSKAEIEQCLSMLRDSETYGDVFVRRP
jgi:FkbM family methyltransferase